MPERGARMPRTGSSSKKRKRPQATTPPRPIQENLDLSDSDDGIDLKELDERELLLKTLQAVRNNRRRLVHLKILMNEMRTMRTAASTSYPTWSGACRMKVQTWYGGNMTTVDGLEEIFTGKREPISRRLVAEVEKELDLKTKPPVMQRKAKSVHTYMNSYLHNYCNRWLKPLCGVMMDWTGISHKKC
jgi:hypothetical protein